MKFICTSDWHLRPDRPLCRTDIDWMETQRQNVREVIDLAQKHGANILHAGDILDIPRTPPNVLTLLLSELSRFQGTMFLIGGNHSIQYHKQEFLMESSLGVLACVSGLGDNNGIQYLECTDSTEDGRFEQWAPVSDYGVVLIHTLTFKKSNDILFGMKATSAPKLIDKFDGYKYLVTGDNHTSFLYEEDGHFVINPGSLNIQSAAHADYEPCVYLLDNEKGTVERIPLQPYHKFVTDNHLVEKRERDGRIESFVETIKKNGKVKLDFESNLAYSAKDMEQDVLDILDEIKQEVI